MAAGYDAVIIFNEGQPGRTELFTGTLGQHRRTSRCRRSASPMAQELYTRHPSRSGDSAGRSPRLRTIRTGRPST